MFPTRLLVSRACGKQRTACCYFRFLHRHVRSHAHDISTQFHLEPKTLVTRYVAIFSRNGEHSRLQITMMHTTFICCIVFRFTSSQISATLERQRRRAVDTVSRLKTKGNSKNLVVIFFFVEVLCTILYF